jgi:DNA repair exonuclease SbcCD ATPase subunit
MKKIIYSLVLLTLLFGAVSVLAQDSDLPSPGVLPDNPFYFLKAWKEAIQNFFTFGAENKAEQFLHLADVRLAEYQKMIEKGKTEIAQKTLDKYEKQLNQALQKIEELGNKGQDVKEISQKLEDAVNKHLEVLQENLQKAPESAQKGLENAIENSSKAIEKVGGKTK